MKLPINRKLLFFFALLCSGWSTHVYAEFYTGWCSPSPAPHDYDFVITKTLGSIDDTHVGQTFVESWYVGSKYSALCDTAPGEKYPVYYKGTSNPDSIEAGNYGGKQFYMLPIADDHLSIAVDISIWDQSHQRSDYHNVPFTDISNNEPGDRFMISSGWGSGQAGNVTLRVEKRISTPIITIPPGTRIAALYATEFKGSYGLMPMVYITIGGTITVPQGCDINVGDTITFALPGAWANDFVAIGQKPQNYTPAVKKVSIHCNNIAMTDELQLRMTATASAEVPDAIQSDNRSDIGVIISAQTERQPQATILTPNSNVGIPFSLDADNGDAGTILSAWPVKTTAATPAPGLFTARSVLQVYYP